MIKKSNKIYFLVGITKLDKTRIVFEDEAICNKFPELAEKINARINRGITKVYRFKNYKDSGEYGLAEYDQKEIHPEDLKIIKKHETNKAYIVGTTKELKYYDFTNDHFLETLRHKKLKKLKEKNLLELDDGTIFGEVRKTIQIPEKIKIIPAHEKDIYVEWDCYNHIYNTDEDDDLIFVDKDIQGTSKLP